MSELDGVKYEQMWITEEETAVVKAMRKKGGKVIAFSDFETEREAFEYVENFPNKVDYWTTKHPEQKFYSTTTKGHTTSVYANYEKKTN